MNKKNIYILVLPLLFFLCNYMWGNTFVSTDCEKGLINVSQPFLYTCINIEVNKLSSEINNGKSCESPIYFSESNSGLIYFADLKNENNISISRELFFSKYNSATALWTIPLNIKKEYSKFLEENKKMNYKEIFFSMDNDIYRLDLENNTYSPQKLNFNTKYIETSPTHSPDGNTLYFISDRKGGYGAKDIWASERLSNGNWIEPYNLGKDINSINDEESPFIMSDGATLYFSSNGDPSIGGFDIFMTTQNDEGVWSIPENIGEPINSSSDDYFYITDSFGKKAYYSSDKLEKGNQDIFNVIFNSSGK